MFRRAGAGVVMVLLLAGCTPVGQFLGSPTGGGSPTPTASPGIPAPTPTPTPTPGAGECDDVVLTDPGEYHLRDCVRLTVRGHDIEVVAQTIDTLAIDGDAIDVDAGDVRSASITGAVNHLDTLDLGSLEVRGDYNVVGVHGSVDRVAIDGDDNTVLADGEVGAVDDRGKRNVVGSQP